MRPIRLKQNRRSDRFMFTDKRHPKRGVLSCVLGGMGLWALVNAGVRIYTSGGQITRAQTVSIALAAVYGIVGLVLAIWMLVRGDCFRLLPTVGILLNGILIAICAGIVVLGLI